MASIVSNVIVPATSVHFSAAKFVDASC